MRNQRSYHIIRLIFTFKCIQYILCGNGLPDWTIARTKSKQFRFPYPYKFSKIRSDDEGVPLIALYYLTINVSKTFQNLFDNKKGIYDTFAEKLGNFIGFEIINEPIKRSIYHSIREFLFPNYGNNHNLLPLYRKVYKEIKKYDDQKIIFFEPCTTDLIDAGFKDTSEVEEYRDREVYSYHIYCFNVNGNSIPKNENIWIHSFFSNQESFAKNLLFFKSMTEFRFILDTPKGNKELMILRFTYLGFKKIY